MLAKPTCLHIPNLYEESTAFVNWESVDGAEGYELDLHFNEDFKAGSLGKTWSDIDETNLSWIAIENLGMTWGQIENLPAQGLSWRSIEYHNLSHAEMDAKNLGWSEIQRLPVSFTVYRGAGNKTRGPDQGLSWQNIDSTALTWVQVEGLGWTWENIELQPSVGLTWQQTDSDNLTWAQMEARSWTWQEFEGQPPRGLTWGSLDGRYLPWNEIEANGLSWKQIENLPVDAKTHIAHTVEIPIYEKKVVFRVRAYKDGEYSNYLTSSLIDTLPRSLVKYKPPCIHVPELHEGRPVDIVWSDLYGAAGYVLERKLGTKEFSSVFSGPGKPVAHPAGCTTEKDYWYTPDGKRHFSCVDQLPYYEKTAQYRIRGYNSTDSSQYQQSAVIPIIPVFYREDSTQFAVKAGAGYLVQLYVKDVVAFENILMTMQYSAAALRLDTLVWNELAGKSDLRGKPFASGIRNISQGGGQVQFYSAKAMRSKNSWDGVLVSARFTALQTTTAQVQLF